jgi:hypothetical protein
MRQVYGIGADLDDLRFGPAHPDPSADALPTNVSVISGGPSDRD